MKFGMPNLVECENLRKCAELAKSQGLDFIEINMSFPEYTPARLNVEEVNSIAREYGLFYTIHVDEALNPFDFNKSVADCYFGVMRDTIRTAKKINAKILNLHLQKGIYVTLPEKVILLTDVYNEEYLASVRAFIALCEEEIGDSGIKISIENVDSNPFSSSQLTALELFLESEAFCLTLDTGHECKLNYKDSHVFEKYPEKLLHMHLHDCKSGSPHLPLGVGEVNIDGKLTQHRGDTTLIEVKTVKGLIESVKYLNNRGIK
ncbi:MAG: sugar phosphate isomerase/epimerase [Ruminococcaceae bacterium]|nr:sugar phosphate isomerase/epimerase [Oscillospiraceae bacterium]